MRKHHVPKTVVFDTLPLNSERAIAATLPPKPSESTFVAARRSAVSAQAPDQAYGFTIESIHVTIAPEAT